MMSARASANDNFDCCTQATYPSIGQVPIFSVPTTSKSLPSKSDELASGIASFKGWYVGVNSGYVRGSSDVQTTLATPSDWNNSYFTSDELLQINQAGIGTINSSGLIGGVQGGYNWQIHRWLFGFELDLNYLGLNSSRQATEVYVDYSPYTFTLNQSVQTNWLVTARPRIGFIVDRFLVYLTGGLSITQLQNNNSFSDNSVVPSFPHLPANAYESANTTTLQYGWVAGAGLEISLAKKWSLKGEYLRANFPTISSSGSLSVNPVYPHGFPNSFSHTANLAIDIARLGVNYHF